MAFTFIQGRDRAIKPGELQKSVEESTKWFATEPNVVFAAAGSGMGQQGVIISFHKYSTLANFDRRLRVEMSEYVSSTARAQPRCCVQTTQLQILGKSRIDCLYWLRAHPHCDIAEPYGAINIFDIVMIASSYGEECTPLP